MERLETDVSDFNDNEGHASGDRSTQAVGGPKSAAAKLKDKAADLGDSVSAAAAAARDQGKDWYAQASDRYQATMNRLDPFVREKPYTALGLAAAAGLLAGLLWAGRGSKVVYLKNRT